MPVTFERTADGVSALVYRLRRGPETFYLRLAERADENLETDAELLGRLRERGVSVARVLHAEPYSDEVGRSVMITTEVTGRPLLQEISSPDTCRAVLVEAGAQLARLNQLTVHGFGWVTRHDRQWPPRAELRSYPEFAVFDLPQPWPGVLASLFSTPVLDVAGRFLEAERRRQFPHGQLAHGDFDLTQIFCDRGRYTGIIDFGEIRGTEPLYDLGHFLLQAEKPYPAPLVPALLSGYQQVQPLPPDHEELMLRSAVLLGLRQLCRWLSPARGFPLDDPAVTRRVRWINHLIRPR